MNHQHENHQHQPTGSEGIDVPLSVWPIWGHSDLISRLVRQFTTEGQSVTLLDVEGILAVTDSMRHGEVLCDAAAAARERTALARHHTGGAIALVLSYEDLDAADYLRSVPGSTLIITKDNPYLDAALWWAVAGAVPPLGVLAVLWEGPALSAAARSACTGAGLAYNGHIVAAEADAFDRAAATAEGLAQQSAGRPRPAHINVGLWSRTPGRGERSR